MGAPPEVMVLAALRTELLFVRGPKAALGMGEAARAGLRRLLNRVPLKGAVFLGYCGGLAEGLPAGALILADRLDGPEGTVRPSGKLLEKAKELLPEAHLGPLFTHPLLLKKEAVRKKALEEGLKPLGRGYGGEFRSFRAFPPKDPVPCGQDRFGFLGGRGLPWARSLPLGSAGPWVLVEAREARAQAAPGLGGKRWLSAGKAARFGWGR
jgi:hypothetical protein